MNIFAWLIISIIGGSGSAIGLYYKEKNSEFSKNNKVLLAFLRGLAITIIIFLLADIFFKTITKDIEKPIIVLLQDNSLSIVSASDSNFIKNEYINNIEQLKKQLSKSAVVNSYTFDEKITLNGELLFDGNLTNISNSLDEIALRYENRNIAAIILASDGIANAGSLDFENVINKINVPIYTIGLGDTTINPDLRIADIKYNKNAAFGNRFPIEVVYEAKNLKAKQTKFRIIQNNKEVVNNTFDIKSDAEVRTETFMLDANEKNLIKLEIILDIIEGEKNTANNRRVIYIEVIDKKHNIAILYYSPHPDIAAIKSALEDAKNYDVQVFNVENLNFNDLKDFDVYIAHQLPSNKHNNPNLNEFLKSSTKPIFFAHGVFTDFNQFNLLNTGIQIQLLSQKNNDYFSSFNTSFSYFSLSDDTKREIDFFPPLTFLNTKIVLTQNTQTLFNQRIGNVTTNEPMYVFNLQKNKTIASIFGEGFFKWKTYNFARTNNNNAFNEIFQKSFNLLVQSTDNRQLRIYHKDKYMSSEDVLITAELFSKSFELTTQSTVKLQITNEENKTIEIEFTKGSQSYFTNLGKLNPGKYTLKATTEIDALILNDKGIFVVDDLNIEKYNTVANHNILRRISETSAGSFFDKNETNKISEYIISNNEFVEIEHQSEKFSELINFRILLFLLMIVLSAEWAYRKYLGSI